MSLKDLRGKIAIVGVGTAGCGESDGMSDLEILAQAAKAAVEDAGLAMKDIDGILHGKFYGCDVATQRG